jgi:hypothetical protein
MAASRVLQGPLAARGGWPVTAESWSGQDGQGQPGMARGEHEQGRPGAAPAGARGRLGHALCVAVHSRRLIDRTGAEQVDLACEDPTGARDGILPQIETNSNSGLVHDGPNCPAQVVHEGYSPG